MSFINNMVDSRFYKGFMPKLYGWGASVVILGALFKIEHYPGASLMLCAGLGCEALIFFMSAFEHQMVAPDWSLVYPELAHLYHPEEFEENVEGKLFPKKPITEQLDDMLEEAKIGPELIQSLSEGMQNLSVNAMKLSGISNAASATDGYVNNLNKAAETVNNLSDSYTKSSEALEQNVLVTSEYISAVKNATGAATTTSDAYQKVSSTLEDDMKATGKYAESVQNATQSAKNLAEKYTQSANLLTKSADAIDFSAIDKDTYAEQLQNVSKNLSALNAVYELQLQSSNEQLEKTQQLQEGMDAFVSNINESVENTSKYKEELAALSQSISNMNKVYGNMLSAMNYNQNV